MQNLEMQKPKMRPLKKKKLESLHARLHDLESTICQIVKDQITTEGVLGNPELTLIKIRRQAHLSEIKIYRILNNNYPSEEKLTKRISEILLKIESGGISIDDIQKYEGTAKPFTITEYRSERVALQPLESQMDDISAAIEKKQRLEADELIQKIMRQRRNRGQQNQHSQHLTKGLWSQLANEGLIEEFGDSKKNYIRLVDDRRVKLFHNKLHYQAFGPGPYRSVGFLKSSYFKLKYYASSIENIPYNVRKGFGSSFRRIKETKPYFTRDIYSFVAEQIDDRALWWKNRKEGIHLWNMAKNNFNKEKLTSFYEKKVIESPLAAYTAEYIKRMEVNSFMKIRYKITDLIKTINLAYSTFGSNCKALYHDGAKHYKDGDASIKQYLPDFSKFKYTLKSSGKLEDILETIGEKQHLEDEELIQKIKKQQLEDQKLIQNVIKPRRSRDLQYQRSRHLTYWTQLKIERLVESKRDYMRSVNKRRVDMALNKLNYQAYGPGPYKNAGILKSAYFKLKDYASSIENTPYNVRKRFSSLFRKIQEAKPYFTRDIYAFVVLQVKDRSWWWKNRKESIYLWNRAKNKANKEKITSFYEAKNLAYSTVCSNCKAPYPDGAVYYRDVDANIQESQPVIRPSTPEYPKFEYTLKSSCILKSGATVAGYDRTKVTEEQSSINQEIAGLWYDSGTIVKS